MSKRAAVYVRISADPEGREHGVRRQEADSRALAARRGWDVVAVYSDNDVSGSGKRTRPGWERLMAGLEAGKVDALVAYSSSRMYRNLRDLARLIDLAESRDIQIATVASGEVDVTTADGRMVARILASVDAAEAERVGERQRRAQKQAREEGRWTGGRRPFGYRPVKVNGGWKLEVDPSEAMIIRDAVTMLLNGASLASVVRTWNDQDITTTLGKRWSPWGVKLVIRRDNPGIVSPRDTHALRQRFPEGTASGGRSLLSGMLWCGECGARIGARGPKYACTGGVKLGTIHLTIGREALETYVMDQAATMETTEATVASDPTEPLVAERDRLEHEMEALGESDLPDAVIRGRARKLERERDRLNEEIARLEPVRVHGGVDFEKLFSSPFAEQTETRIWLETLIDRIVVKPGRGERNRALRPEERVMITWRDGVEPAGEPHSAYRAL